MYKSIKQNQQIFCEKDFFCWKWYYINYHENMKKSFKKTTIHILYIAHLLIVIVRLWLFFIPTKLRPWRISFHFRYIAIILAAQFLWSIILIKKAGMICPVTTLMQYMRGYKCDHKKNYDHSFIAELLETLNIHISFQTINILLLATFVWAAILYFCSI